MEPELAIMRPLVTREELHILLGGKEGRKEKRTSTRGRMPLLEVLAPMLGLRGFLIPKLTVMLVMLPMAWVWGLVRVIGAGQAFALVTLCGLAGAVLVSRTGLAGFKELSACLHQGRDPEARHMDRFLFFLAGVFLLVPGPVTALAGFLLLIPQVRNGRARSLRRAMRVWSNSNTPR